MALTYHGDDSCRRVSQNTRIVLDEGLARYFDVKCLGGIGPGSGAEGRFLKRYVFVERRRVRVARRSGEGWAVHCADGHSWMSIFQQFLEPEQRATVVVMRTRSWQGSVMKLPQRASGLITHISMDRPELPFSSKTVMSTIAKPLEVTKSRLQKIARYLKDNPVLQYVCAYQNEVDECMAFGDSDWARDRETRRSTTAVLEKKGNPLH